MPDYTEWPLTFEEFEKKNGNPFEHAGPEHDHDHSVAPAHAVEKGAH
jgi:hypothetical protein